MPTLPVIPEQPEEMTTAQKYRAKRIFDKGIQTEPDSLVIGEHGLKMIIKSLVTHL